MLAINLKKFKRYALIAFCCLAASLSSASTALAESLSGTMSVSTLDYTDGTHLDQYVLNLADGSYVFLNFTDVSAVSSHALQSGAELNVEGSYTSSNNFTVTSVTVVAPAVSTRSSSSTTRSVSAEADNASGTRNAVIILVSIDGNDPYCTADEIEETMYTGEQSARGIFETASKNQLTFESDSNRDGRADIFGPYSISSSTGSCSNLHGWGQAAYEAARSAGVDFSPYQHRIFVLPRGCGLGGQAGVGCGDQCTTYILDCHRRTVWAHELGHNFGMEHAGDDLNNDGRIENEYGDTSCPMGYSPRYEDVIFNAPHTTRMGWFDAFSGAVETISSTRHMNIAPMEADTATAEIPQVLKVQKGSGEYYYLSYRTATGTYDEVPTEFRDKLNIHRVSDSSRQTGFVDAIAVGGSFTDSTLGITICHNSSSNSSLNVSIVFGSYDCDGADEPTGGSTGRIPGDSDGDGTTNAQEIADGTNPGDPGSYMERLSSPVYTLWNSFLGMYNILELVNPSSSSSNTVTVSLYSIDGNHVYSQELALAAGQQYDIILNDFPGFLANSYGIIMVTYTGELDGRMSYYKTSGTNYEFAYSVPLATSLRGTTGVSFNTFQPSTNLSELNYRVNNWLTVVNLADSTKDFQVKTYDQSGNLLATQNLSIPAFGRSDIDGGHNLVGANVVGFHEIIPADADAPYISQLTRYGTNAEGNAAETAYFFAFPLSAHAGNGEVMYLPISRQFGETNWVEVVNTTNATVQVTLDFYDSEGNLSSQTQTLSAHSQVHIQADSTLLDSGERGYVRITPNTSNSIIAQSMLYYKDANGGIDAMSGIQAREALGSSYSGSYNLFLGMQNWLTISNLTSSSVSVTIDAVSTSSSGSTIVTIDANSTTKVPVHDTSALNVSSDTYGSLDLTPDTIRSLIVDLHRVRYVGSEMDFAFPTAVRGR